MKQNQAYSTVQELAHFAVPVDEVRNKIRTFLNESNSRTTYSAEEAVWYIEALPNYFEGDASVSYKKLNIAAHYYHFGHSATSSVSAGQIASIADDIRNQAVAEKEAAACTDNEKHTIVVDVSPVRNNATGEVFIKAEIATGLQCGDGPTEDPVEDVSLDPCSYNSSIHWKAIVAGTCGSGPQLPSTEAYSATEIRDIINSFDETIGCRIRNAHPTPGGFFANNFNTNEIYANFPISGVFSNPDDDIPFDGYRDFWLLESWDDQATPIVDCLDPNEMQYYLDGAYSVIAWMFQNGNAFGYQMNGRQFEFCRMGGDILPNGTANNLHFIDIHYGDYVP